MDLGLKDKVAIVTGAGRGIGRNIASTLANEGAHVVVADNVEENAKATCEEIGKLGGDAISIVTDVTDRKSIKDMTDQVLEKYKKIDILVNNAAVFGGKFFVDDDEENWEKVINVCLYGVLNCTKAVINHMIDNKYGKIVNMSSDAGKVGEARMAVYAAAKGGILAFTKSLAMEVGRYDINVNAIAPGMTKTPLFVERVDAEREAKLKKLYPLKRLGELQDVAGVVAILTSDATSWVTGQAISVNGGFSMA